MKRNMLVSLIMLCAALVTLGVSDSCKAPMDATGDYSGTWSINIKEGETVVDTADCGSIRMTLAQDVTLDPPDNLKVTGTITTDDYACFAEAGWPEPLIPKPEPVEVSGTMSTQDGKIVLVSGGIGTGSGAIFLIDGLGEPDTQSAEEIPPMIKYSGKWGFAVSVVFIGTTGVGGTFDVTRDN